MLNKPQKVVFLYLIVSIAWIVLSDHLADFLSAASGVPTGVIQSSKGIFFVLVTGWLLYLAIKQQQHILLNSEKQYKSIFYSNPNPLWIYDINTLKFLEVNEAAIRIYGYSRQEFRKMKITDIQSRESAAQDAGVTHVPNGFHVAGNCQHTKKNGKVSTVLITSHRILFNNRESVMVMAQDVTARLQLEKRLKILYKVEKELKEELERNIMLIKQSLEEKQRLAEVVDRINNMVIITDRQGIIIWVNQAFTNFTGYSFDEVIGKASNFLHGPKTDTHVQEKIMEAIRKNDFATFEILNYTKDGQEYWVELNISAIYNDKHEIVRYISIQNIITERKKREERIREQNKTLRNLAWTNSHALRKPVSSLLGLVDLSKGMKHAKEIKEIHSLIEICSAEMDAIIKGIGKEINDCEEEDF